MSKCKLCKKEKENKNVYCSKDCWYSSLSLQFKNRIQSDSWKEKNSQSLKKRYATDLVTHNKGKTKDSYLPLKVVSEKMTGVPKSKESLIKMGLSQRIRLSNPAAREAIRRARAKQKIEYVAKYETYLYDILTKHSVPLTQQYRIYATGLLTIVDLYYPPSKLCIYIDGRHWHRKDDRGDDKRIDKRLLELGYQVLRIRYNRFRDLTQKQIRSHLRTILKRIRQ